MLGDKIGQKFGRWTILNEIRIKGRIFCVCRCSCGFEKILKKGMVVCGGSKSCGCLKKYLSKKRATTHGMSKTRYYRKWQAMLSRCYNPKNNQYKNYGARGIRVCKRWHSFENFYKDMGDRPNNMFIDRINNDGNYCKENCRWATQTQQQNNKRNNYTLTLNGQTKTATQWSKILGIKYRTILGRKSYGWDDVDTLTLPVKGHRNP